VAAVEYALSLGQNHIDTAEMYANGRAERVVGEAIKSVERDDIFIATKLWKNHVANDAVRPAVEAMLERLGASYIDLLYIHAPWFDAPWQEAIPQICQLIDEGVVRYIGVSNFNAVRLQEALDLSTYPIAANQMHYSFGHRSEVTPELKELCAANNVTIVAYSPLERGDLTSNRELLALADKYHAPSNQVALAWLLSQGTLPIPKAQQPSHIEENAKATDVRLDPEDIR